MILRRMAWVASAALVFAGVSLAQITAISGGVKGEDGAPLKGAVIKIDRTDIKGHYETKTNKKGEYYHGGLPLGTYDVTLEVDGKPRDKVSKLRTTMGDPVPVNFNLQEIKKRQDAFSEAAKSGQLTAEMARGMTAEQKAEFDKVNKERRAQALQSKELNDAYNAGMAAEQAKQYDAAVESFKKAVEVDPKQHVVWAHLGDSSIYAALAKTGAERDALITVGTDAWNKAIELLPTDAAYHNNFALALARVGKMPEAEVELQKAATLDPPQAGRYYFNLGALMVNSGKTDAAVEAFKKAVAATPDYAEAHYQYGISLMGKATYTADGKVVAPPGAQEEFETYLKLAPTGPNAATAQQMLDSINAGVQTTYRNPNAPAPAPKKATKKK